MKFVVSSSELLGRLQSVSRVIASKNTLPILDNFCLNYQETNLPLPLQIWKLLYVLP